MILNLAIPASSYPEIHGSRSGRCVVIGSAACVWQDLAAIKPPYEVVCVNDIIMHYPGPVTHAYSNNHHYLERWRDARRDQFNAKYGPVELTHSNIQGGDVTWPWPGHGTSALGATYTALALGYDDVILCGVPLDDSHRYFEPPWLSANFIREVPHKGDGSIKYWASAAEKVFEGRVRARSGRLVELLDKHEDTR